MTNGEVTRSRRWLRMTDKTVRHPLTLLILGTAVGSVAIPAINAKSASREQLVQLRTEHARSAMSTANDVDKRLNAILTTFSNYSKDELSQSPDQKRARDALMALRERVYDQYSEFDAGAWWWHWRFQRDAMLLRLVDEDGARQIAAACRDYQQTLMDTVNELGRLWRPLMKGGPVMPGDLPEQHVRRRIAELRDERLRAVERMVSPLLH